MATARCILAVPAAQQAAANAYAQQWDGAVTQEDLDASARTFSAGLSPTGNPPPTWYWCSTVLQASKLQAMRDKIALMPPSVRWVVLAGPNMDDNVVATNIGAVSVGQPLDVEALLAAVGLKRVP